MNAVRSSLRLWLPLVAAFALGAVAVLVLPQPLQAGDDIPIKKKDLPPAIDGATADAAITVWLDTSPIGRRRPAAKRLTALHAEMAKRGYALVMMMPMNENNDTAGFWVTYRPAR